jgi:hypothetical protein
METIKLIGQDFANLLFIAALALYAASRVIRQQWETESANRLRSAIAWLLFGFATVLLIVSISHLPGCVKQRNQPSVQGQPVQQAQPNPGAQSPVPQQQQNP